MSTLTTSIPLGSWSLYIAVCQRVTRCCEQRPCRWWDCRTGVRRGSGAAGRHPLPMVGFRHMSPPPSFCGRKGRRGRAGPFPLVAAMFFAKHRRNEHYFREIVDFYLEKPQKNRLFLGKNRLFGRACPKRWRYRDSVASCPLQRRILDVFLIHEFVRRYKGDAPNIGRKRGIQLRLHVVQFIRTAE